MFIELGSGTLEFGESMLALAEAEPNQTLSRHMTILGELQQKVKELHEKQVCYEPYPPPFGTKIFVSTSLQRLLGSKRCRFFGGHTARIHTDNWFREGEKI